MDSFHDWIIFIRILGIMIHHHGLKFILEMIDMCYVMYMYIYIYITRRTHTSVYDRDCDIPQNNVPLSKQPEFHALFLFGSGEVLQPPSKPGPAIFVGTNICQSYPTWCFSETFLHRFSLRNDKHIGKCTWILLGEVFVPL